jgi:DNA-binding GntR family transcriptional regulator
VRERATRVDIYQQLREAIVTGVLSADAPLTELSLAAQYKVSRTPVREALRRLEQDGLVERGPRGMKVRGRSPEEILEIYEVRITLEGAAARAAAERRTELICWVGFTLI